MLLQPVEHTRPYSHLLFDNCVPEWEELNTTFPDSEFFLPSGGYRSQGQAPHSRLLLQYGANAKPGVVTIDNLSESWVRFIKFIQGPEYAEFIQEVTGEADFDLRLAWHRGRTGDSVSPHVDSARKIATHLFYFNQGDWSAWGGDIVLLGGLQQEVPNPEFDDFNDQVSHGVTGDRSILFRPLAGSWHGVRPLSCPPEIQRRLFQVCARTKKSLYMANGLE